MNEYIFEITQVLKKEVKIKCMDELQAQISIKNAFEDGTIRLTQDECVDSQIKLIKSEENDQPELFDQENI